MPRPFRLTPPPVYEQDIHEATARALDMLLAPPAMWCHYPAGAVQLAPHETARLTRLGLKRGMPDLMIFYFGLWGLELKRPGSKLSKTRIGRTARGAPRVFEGQEDVFPKLIATGAWAAIEVAHSVEEVLGWVQKWGIPTRGRLSA